MGAVEFYEVAHGETAQEAFTVAVQYRQHIDGHGGWTGTIAEKTDFILITESRTDLREKIDRRIQDGRKLLRRMRLFNDDDPEVRDLREEIKELRLCHQGLKRGAGPYDIANILLRLDDGRVSEKYGPAGCIDLTPSNKRKKRFLFFGLAPE